MSAARPVSPSSASRRSWGAALSTPPPAVAIEIASRRVTAVAVAARRGAITVGGHATEVLVDQALTPSLTSVNITDRPAVAAAVQRAIGGLGVRARRVALVVPDSIAKVSIVRFEKVPAKTADLDQLIRWQVRKAAPFRLEDAQVSYAAGAPLDGGGREYTVVIARRDIVEEYEQACTAAGLQPGLVDLSSFNLINLVLAGDTRARQGTTAPIGDWLLVNLTPDHTTLAIVRGEHLVFHRNRRTEGETDLADMVHQTAMYYEDRLGGVGFSRVVLAGAAATGGAASLGGAEVIRRALQQRLETRVDAIDPRAAASLSDRLGTSPDLLDDVAAPLGALVRERVA